MKIGPYDDDSSKFQLEEMLKNRHHTVTVSSTDSETKAISVVNAYSPSQVMVLASSQWDSPFASITEGLGNSMAGFGFTLKTKPLTAQVWQGSQAPQIQLDLTLYAVRDPWKDVVEPALKLMKMAYPGLRSWQAYIPPGPNFVDYLRNTEAWKQLTSGEGFTSDLIGPTLKKLESIGGETINVQLGTFLRFENVVVIDASPTFSLQHLTLGRSEAGLGRALPRTAQVQFAFRMYTAPAKPDIDSMFTKLDVREVGDRR